MKPLVVREFMGKLNFGMISGLMAMPYLLCSAIAPYVGSLVWTEWNYDGVLLVMAMTSLTALGCFGLLLKSSRNQPATA